MGRFGASFADLVPVVEHDVLPPVDVDVEAGHPGDGAADDVQVAAAVVVGLAREEGAVDVAHVVVDRPAAAVPPGQADLGPAEEGHVRLRPGVLVAADHHARAVPPQEQEVLEEPKKKCKVKHRQ